MRMLHIGRYHISSVFVFTCGRAKTIACPLEIIQNLKGFRIGHINIASLTRYIDQVQIYLHKESFDILSVNETRLDKQITDSIVNINGYSIARYDRNRDGGGVAIFY